MRPRKAIRIELTAEQSRQIREATGKEAKAIEITIDGLEEQLPESYLCESRRQATPLSGRGPVPTDTSRHST